MALHLFGLLRVDLDGVDSVLIDASLVEIGTVAELLLFIRNLCAIRHNCGFKKKEMKENCVKYFQNNVLQNNSNTSKLTWSLGNMIIHCLAKCEMKRLTPLSCVSVKFGAEARRLSAAS